MTTPTTDFYPVLRQRFSPERMAPYERLAGGDVDGALALYEWNIAVSGRFYEVLQTLEVLLRNALHEQLDGAHAAAGLSGMWFDDPAGRLAPQRLDDIAAARRRLRRNGKPETAGRIIAELSFGFWRYLLASRYEQTLWTPTLRHAFPGLRPRRRSTVYEWVERLNRLRNRVAHHEPIHHLDLSANHTAALALADAICPTSREWLGVVSRVPDALAARPDRLSRGVSGASTAG